MKELNLDLAKEAIENSEEYSLQECLKLGSFASIAAAFLTHALINPNLDASLRQILLAGAINYFSEAKTALSSFRYFDQIKKNIEGRITSQT